MHSEENAGTMSGGGWWNLINSMLGVAGTATGITALATKVPKNGRYHNNNYGGGCHHGNYSGDGVVAPSAFQAWEKECEDAVALTSAIYRGRIAQMEDARQARETDIQEKFSLFKNQIDADFGLYKEMRDRDDAIYARLSELETKVAVSGAIRPYQDALINCKIDKVADHSAYALDRRTCRMIEGELVLPNTPTVTGFQSASRCGCNNTPATPAQGA